MPCKKGGGITARLFVVSAPSGAGKTTLLTRIRKRFPQVAYSVSHTTREKRPGEIDGQAYHFVSLEQFKEMIESDHFLEWAPVYDQYYGTSKLFIDQCLADQRPVILEIDIQGARKVAQIYPDHVSIFIMPPSIDVLEERLKQRGEDPAKMERRLGQAAAEMAEGKGYHHIVVNDDLDMATDELAALFERYLAPEVID